MDLDIPHHSTSVEDEECSSSSGSFNNIDHHQRNNNGKRSKPIHHEYALSCGMTLPKRHRRRRSLSDDQFKNLLASYSGCNPVSHEPSSKSSSETMNQIKEQHGNRRRRSHRRSPTPFPSLLNSNEPFQQYVRKISSSQYESNGKSKTDQRINLISKQNIAPSILQVLPQLRSTILPSSASPAIVPSVQSATFVAHQDFDTSYNCDIVLSNQILSMADALEFSSKPHCLIEATSPHRVLHSNAALFTSLLHNNHQSITSRSNTEPATAKVTLSDSIPPTIPSTAPSSLSSSWETVQSQINLLFGLCFASTPPSSSQANATCNEKKGIVTLYPVYSTKSDFEQLMSGTNSANGTGESFPPRYYLIEVVNVENTTVVNQPSAALSSIPMPYDEKRTSSVDGMPKLVIA